MPTINCSSLLCTRKWTIHTYLIFKYFGASTVYLYSWTISHPVGSNPPFLIAWCCSVSFHTPVEKCAHQQQARWYLSYSTGPLSAGKVDVTLAAFGSVPDGCDALPVVMAIPEDGCLPLRNAQKV